MVKLVPLHQWKITSASSKGTNVLGIVMFSVIFGATIGKMQKKGKPLLDFFVSLSEAMMIITSWVIWYDSAIAVIQNDFDFNNEQTLHT